MTNLMKKTSTIILVAVFLSTICLAIAIMPSKAYADGVPYVIGDVGPAGGRVFYDKGDDSGGWRYLEASTSDLTDEDQINWGSSFPSYPGATSTGVGTGKVNTQTIFDYFGINNYAAYLCYNLTSGGYDDWFLPSKDELNEMYLHKEAIGGFGDFGYWSSSESDNRYAWYQEFGITGTQALVLKNSWASVRAIRSFSGVKETASVVEKPWVRTMPMTCFRVWINQDDKFQFVFWYPYRNNNWVRIYDMDGKEVYSIDMPYDNPNLIVDLPDGMYTVKTFTVGSTEPIQTFVIGK